MLCETGTLLVRTTHKTIQAQTPRFCRVSYIDLLAAMRKLGDARTLTNTWSDSAHFKPDLEIRR
jgi:hypothetical protein